MRKDWKKGSIPNLSTKAGTALGSGRPAASARTPPRPPRRPRRAPPMVGLTRGSKISKTGKILQNFGGLVLGCTKMRFYKKICVWQHFSSSTRFASFCTAATSKFSQKNQFEKSEVSAKFQQKVCKCCKCCKCCKMLQNVAKCCKISKNSAR